MVLLVYIFMKHIYIATSKIQGFGIMSGEDVKKGEIIRYIKGDIQFKVNKNKKDALAHPNWIGIADNQWIDPEKPYKFLNHSCNPSAGIKGKVSLIAIKDIREGEEITIDYSIIEGDPRWEMTCNCGNLNCRKIIRSIEFLPNETFKKYLPFIPKYFQKIYKNKI